MIKYVFVLFIITNFTACNSHSQTVAGPVTEFGIVIIDSSIKIFFFEVPPKRIEANVGEVRINSYIREPLKSIPLFDTCRCFKTDDSLVMEFKELLSSNSDTIKIKIFNNTYNAYYIRRGINYPAVSGSLKFHDKAHAKGQEIFGELGLEFVQNDQNSTRFFKGPFRCTIE